VPSRREKTEDTRSLRLERGEQPEAEAGTEEQDAELPLGPLREGIVDLHSAEQEQPTVQADRAEAERRERG
jgi:hypothetical protein